jgi:hypothetical protein
MSKLSETTERKVILLLKKRLPHLEALASLKMTAEDAVMARSAENLIKSIIEISEYFAAEQGSKITLMRKVKQ